MVRPHRLKQPETYFHVTARGNNRQDIFQSDGDKRDYLRRLAKIFPSFRIRLFAHCIMTNHLHLLIQDVTGTGMSSAMHRLQGEYAQAWNKRYRRSGTIYERRFHAKPVEDDSYLLSAAIYIHANPPEPHSYPWSSYSAYLGCRTDIPVNTALVLELCGGATQFKALVKERRALGDTDELSKPVSVRGQEILGSEEFRLRLEPLIERRALRRRSKARPKGASLDNIFRSIAKISGVTAEQIRGRSRKAAIARSRALFCAFAIQEGIAHVDLAREINRTITGISKLARRGAPDLLEHLSDGIS